MAIGFIALPQLWQRGIPCGLHQTCQNAQPGQYRCAQLEIPDSKPIQTTQVKLITSSCSPDSNMFEPYSQYAQHNRIKSLSRLLRHMSQQLIATHERKSKCVGLLTAHVKSTLPAHQCVMGVSRTSLLSTDLDYIQITSKPLTICCRIFEVFSWQLQHE